MYSFEVITDHHIRVIDQWEDKITHEQVENFYQTHLADLLIFRCAVLEKQLDLFYQFRQDYLICLREWDRVEIELSWPNGDSQWHGTVIFNDGKMINIQSSFYDNKIKLNSEGSKLFSTTDGSSEKQINDDGEYWHYHIKIPKFPPIESTQLLLHSKVRDEIKELYRQVIDTKTSYVLVNALKYWYSKKI